MSSEIDKKIDELLAAFNNFSKDIESKSFKEKTNNNSQNRKNTLEEKNNNIDEEMIDLKRRMVKLEDKMDNRFDILEKRIRSIMGIVGENMADIADINKRIEKQIS